MSQTDILIIIFTMGIFALGYSIWFMIDHVLHLISKINLNK